jgi:mRNA-degrading endonuclease HigB of HigAB toxin-antitoxin module
VANSFVLQNRQLSLAANRKVSCLSSVFQKIFCKCSDIYRTFLSLYRYGNTLLIQAIDQLVDDLENKDCSNQQQLKNIRPDADLVHNDGFYIFNIQVHRVMILIEFEYDGEATIVWCGSHDEYETTFKNNKSTIKKWLNNQGLIN